MRSSLTPELFGQHTSNPTQRAFVAAEQLRLLFAKGAYPHVTSILSALLYAAVIWKDVPHRRLFCWLGLIFIFAGSRILVQRLYFRYCRGTADAPRWATINAAGAALHGLTWGSAAILAYPEHAVGGQMMLALVTAGMTAGASTLSATHLPSYFAFAIAAAVPLAIRMFSQPDRLHLVIGVLVLLFAGFMGALARSSNRASREAIELRFLLASLNKLAARRADELEQFAGRVAHDILGPLTSAKMALTYAGEHTDDQGVQRMLARGNRGVARVSTIVDGLLRFARAGARPEPGVSTRVRPTLEAILAELEPLAAQAHAQLIAGPLPECAVACNAGVLTSLVENLVRNALKYMGERPYRRVVLRVLCGAGHAWLVRFEVEDTGPGIAPSLLESVFEPYLRADETGQAGIGLGLATVRRISEAHGGRAGATSTVGVGSTFWFELPRADLGPDARRAGPPPADLSAVDAHVHT